MNWYKRHIYAGLDAYTVIELVQKLKMLGIVYVGEGRGDHKAFKNLANGEVTELPIGGKKSVNPETIKQHVINKLNIPFNVWKSLPKKPKKKDIKRIEHLLPWHDDPAKHNIEIGEPTPDPHKDEPWMIKYKQQLEEERLRDAEETRQLEEMIRQDELSQLKPVFAENKMNWYKKAKKVPGGLADKKKPSDFNKQQLDMGVEVEMEHTDDKSLSRDVAMDHLEEFPTYYTELEEMENKLEKKKPATARRGRYRGGLQRINSH